MKKTSMSNPVKNLGYNKCYSSSNPRHLKSPNNFIRLNSENQAHMFFRTTTGIQSGQDVFDESRLVITYLTNLEVTEICSFTLVVEGKTGKETPES